jgi:isoamylase
VGAIDGLRRFGVWGSEGEATPTSVRLPGPPWAARYSLLWDSAFAQPPGRPRGPAATVVATGAQVQVSAGSIRVYGAQHGHDLAVVAG